MTFLEHEKSLKPASILSFHFSFIQQDTNAVHSLITTLISNRPCYISNSDGWWDGLQQNSTTEAFNANVYCIA
eukprot:scaffold22559_cov111-Cylindrotheca_fusiformis.AAC.17